MGVFNNGLLYVTEESGSVVVINPATNSIINSISGFGDALEITMYGNYGYVADHNGNLFTFNTISNSITNEFPLSGLTGNYLVHPNVLAYIPTSNAIAIGGWNRSYYDSTPPIDIINVATNTLVKSIFGVTGEAEGMALSPNGNEIITAEDVK